MIKSALRWPAFGRRQHWPWPLPSAARTPRISTLGRHAQGDVSGLGAGGFDDKVRVTAPLTAENAMNVPVSVDASALQDVRENARLCRLQPIVRVVRFEPTGAQPSLGFRIKLQQSAGACRGADGQRQLACGRHLGGTPRAAAAPAFHRQRVARMAETSGK